MRLCTVVATLAIPLIGPLPVSAQLGAPHAVHRSHGRQIGRHTCGITVGTKGTPVSFESAGAAHDAALYAEADEIRRAMATAQMTYEMASKYDGAFVTGRDAKLLFVRGANGFACGALHCFLDVFALKNGKWRSVTPQSGIADNVFLYNTNRRIPDMSAVGNIGTDSYVDRFDPDKNTYVECSTETRVQMRYVDGNYVVPVLINDAITLDFMVDSGAADVAIPADVFLTLTRAGTIQKSDFIGEKTYVLADGSKLPSATFTIRSLKIGDVTVHNVTGNVTPVQGPLLLGQDFLEQFGSWSIDNTSNELVLH